MTFQGSLSELHLPDIVQLMSVGGKTGVFHLTEGERHGKIYLRGGQIVHAELDELQGEEAVYYRNAEGKVTRLATGLAGKAPNGVILSPDEKTLYVVCSMQDEVMAYPVEQSGTIGEGKVFARLKQREGQSEGGGDGLTLDVKGNLYITSGLGVQIFSPDGKLLGVIALPEQPANVTFGGPDRKTLYATARTSLYAVPMEAQGHAFPGKAK